MCDKICHLENKKKENLDDKKQEKSRFFGGFRLNTAEFNIENQVFEIISMKRRIYDTTKGNSLKTVP